MATNDPQKFAKVVLGSADKFRTEEMTAIADRQQGTERQDMDGKQTTRARP